MRIEILHQAEEELTKAVAYYDEIEPGLGLRLKDEIHKIIRWIGDHPEIPRLRPKGYRQVNLKVFRYYIAYFIWNDTVWILAVAHGSRHPEYWMERKQRPG